MPRLIRVDGVTHAFPDDASDADIAEALGGSSAPKASSGWTLGDVARGAGDLLKGIGKGALHTALDLGEAAGRLRNPFDPAAGTLSDAVDQMYGTPGISKDSFSTARNETGYTNNTQRVGGALETAAELAMPVGEAANAIPRAARAGAKFQDVMGAARNIPIDISGPGNVALRIQELADRGGSMPMAVRKFLLHVTDPNKPPMTYEVARDFASNISRLSADEFGRLTPAVGKEVASMRVALNKAVADAAGKAGKAREFVDAMTEYSRAKRLENVYNSLLEGVKKGLPYATAAGAGGWLGTKLRQLLPSGD